MEYKNVMTLFPEGHVISLVFGLKGDVSATDWF